MNRTSPIFIILLSLMALLQCSPAFGNGLDPVDNFRVAGTSGFTPPAASAAADSGYPWRGLLIGGDHGPGNIHHDNVYVSINSGPVIYLTTVPARKTGNLLADEGLLWHFYTRDNTQVTLYATSALVNNVESELSDAFPLFFSYPEPATCTQQTVPQPVVQPDQVVNVGQTVTLDGSASYDPFEPDNDNLAYVWECYAAPETAVDLSGEGKLETVTFTPNAPGDYYFRFSLRDKVDDTVFNRSPVAYVKIRAVEDMELVHFIDANPGRTRQASVGQTITLDGSRSKGSHPITGYVWTLENPLGEDDIQALAQTLGTHDCQESCFRTNYDADSDVDGMDLALMAAHYGQPELPEQAQVPFTPALARPYIFRLTVSDGTAADSDTTIVAVNHENASLLLTPPPADPACLPPQ